MNIFYIIDVIHILSVLYKNTQYINVVELSALAQNLSFSFPYKEKEINSEPNATNSTIKNQIQYF